MFPEYQEDLLRRFQMVMDAIPEGGTKEEKKLAFGRISAKLDQMPKEYHVTLKSDWQKSLMEVLCKQHGLRTYRYPKQKQTTVMIWVSAVYMDTILWPQYLKYSKLLQEHINDGVNIIINKILQEVPKLSSKDQLGPVKFTQPS